MYNLRDRIYVELDSFKKHKSHLGFNHVLENYSVIKICIYWI